MMTQGELIDYLSANAETAYFPVTESLESMGFESRYFGRPWMEIDRDWPVCNGEPMAFILQLDLAKLPGISGLPRQGLLSLFHAGGYDEAGKNSAVILQDTSAPGELRYLPEGMTELPASHITSWIDRPDMPHLETLQQMLETDGKDGLTEFVEDVYSMTFGTVLNIDGFEISEKDALSQQVKYAGHCFECDKLGGYPYWAQGDETPKDSKGNAMLMVFQHNYDAGPLLGGLHGAETNNPCYGIGHIWYSPETGETYHNWACD